MNLAPAALLASAFLHASWNALLKRERAPQVAVAGVLSFALMVAIVAALATARPAFSTSAALGWGLAAGAFEGLYFITLAAALARVDYGLAYTVARGGAMLLVWPAARVLLREPVSLRGTLGASLVGLGLALVTAQLGGRSSSRAGIGFSIACAVSIAGYHLCYDRALAAGARSAPLFAVALAVALPFVLASLRGRFALGASGAPWGVRAVLRWAFAGVLCAGSFLLFLWGLASSGAAVALTLRNTSIMFAQVLALALGERPTHAQVAGALLIAAGATLVAGR